MGKTLNTILDMMPGGNDNYISRTRTLDDMLNSLGEVEGISDEQRENIANMLQKEKNATGFSGALTGMSGVLSMGNQISEMMTPADTSKYDAQLNKMSNLGKQNYFSNNSLLQSYDQLPRFSVAASDLNPTAGESALQIGSTTLNGAITGYKVGGIYGAIIGGAAGLLGGGVADYTRRRDNAFNADSLTLEQENQRVRTQSAMNVGADQVRDMQFGTLYGGRKALGGFIRAYGERPIGYRIHHNHCKGGTLVRIKTK